MKRTLPFLIIAAVLFAALIAGLWLYRAAQPEATGSGDSIRAAGNSVANKATAAAIAPGAQPPHALGAENAPVTIEEFGDYQCPPCAALHTELQSIKAEQGERLRIVFREFTLNDQHKHAPDAARAAEAAALQGRFWEMHDRLYSRQAEWAKADEVRPLFAGYARELGLDVERFRRDMDGETVNNRIASDNDRARSLGVRATPTLFINNREVPPGNMSPVGIRVAITLAAGEKKR